MNLVHSYVHVISSNLKDVMVFVTGCESIPPLGFGNVRPSIQFASNNILLTVSTCSLTLKFPLNFPTNFKDFKRNRISQSLDLKGFFGSM